MAAIVTIERFLELKRGMVTRKWVQDRCRQGQRVPGTGLECLRDGKFWFLPEDALERMYEREREKHPVNHPTNDPDALIAKWMQETASGTGRTR